MRANVLSILEMCVDLKQLCSLLISILGGWGRLGGGGSLSSTKRIRTGNKPLEVGPLLIEVPLSPDATQCVRMSSNMSPLSGSSIPLIGSFSPLINSVSTGWNEPSWNKMSSIDQCLQQTYPSVYMNIDIKRTKEECVILSRLCIYVCLKAFLSLNYLILIQHLK